MLLGGKNMTCDRCKEKPRKDIQNLKNRIHRIQGQLNGVEKMID